MVSSIKAASVVFIGHVDAGKSTTCGQILIGSGQIDERVLKKYSELATKNNRDSWWIAYLMDASDEERSRGKTVELGSACFSLTPDISKPPTSSNPPLSKSFVIWDAPGHKNYISNMVSGVFLADFAVLIVSARTGEFESGFEKGGQTREHAFLAKASGIDHLIIAVNKMDDISVNWDIKRFLTIKTKIQAFLKSYGFKGRSTLSFIPISGQTGENIFKKSSEPTCAWIQAQNLPTLMEAFEELHDRLFSEEGSEDTCILLITALDNEKDVSKLKLVGVKSLMGKACKGMVLRLPGKKAILEIEETYPFEENGKEGGVIVNKASGRADFRMVECLDLQLENSKSKLRELDILTTTNIDIYFVALVEAKMKVVQIGSDKPLLTKGFPYTLYCTSGTSECEIESFHKMEDGKKLKAAISGTNVIAKIRLCGKPIAMCEAEICKQLSRFVLREGPNTVAVGMVGRVLLVND